MKAEARVVTFAVLLAACSKDPPAQPPAVATVTPVVSATPATPSASTSPPPKAAARTSTCRPPPPGSTSDDVTPSIRGAATDDVELLPWLDARGVAKPAALAWLASHYGHGITKEQAEMLFGYSHCGSLKVGEGGEDALLCRHAISTQIMQGHALVLTVRAKRPVALLDVGLDMVAMDFPDARWLDLALTVAPDGKSAVLDDRAPDGTTLVAPESDCRRAEKHDDECEAKLAAHPNPESLARKTPGGESFASFDDGCFAHRDKSGRIVVLRRSEMPSPMPIYPATLHDCKGGRAELAKLQSDASMREALVFFDKSCAQRGTWVWQKDRFVKKL